MLNKWMGNPIVRNAGWLMGGKLVQMAVNFLIGLLTARYLGPSDYGLIGYAAAYTGFFSAFCKLGLNPILVKELTDAPDKDGELLGTSLFLQAVSSILSAIVILCLVSVADRGDPTAAAVVSLSNVGMVFQIFDIFHCWFQFKMQSKVTALVSLAAYLITAAYKAALLVLGKPVTWFALATALDYICIAAFLLLAYGHHHGGKLRISLERARQLLQKSCHFILPGLMVAVYAQTDKIMLKQLIGEAEIGYYSTAASLCNVWCFVLAAVIDAFYPEITNAHKTDAGLFARRNKQLYAILFYVSAAVSLLITCCAKPAVALLYGKAYLPAVTPLRVLTWHTAFSYLGVARNAWIVCENRQKYLIWVYAAAAAVNVLLNRLLIPAWGAAGAAGASLTAQVVTAIIAPCFIPGLRENAKLMADGICLKNVWRADYEQ